MQVVWNEVTLLLRLDHPSVLQLVELFTEGDCWYIVTTLMSGCELLHDVVENGCFSEDDARVVMRQLLTSLDHLHAHGVVHRDVKLENIMFESSSSLGAIRLIDFGLATSFSPGQMLHDACGTPHCIAPEVLQSTPCYDAKVDIWACGVVLFTLLAGVPPFVNRDFRSLFFTIRTGSFSFENPVWGGVSLQAKDLINTLLQVDPNKRPSAAEVLNHPWLQGAGMHSPPASML